MTEPGVIINRKTDVGVKESNGTIAKGVKARQQSD